MNRDEALEALRQKKRTADAEGLLHASRHGNAELVRLYLDAGVDPNESAKSGERSLKVAVERHHVAVVRLLLERGASADIPLLLFAATYAAAFNDGTELIELVARAGASPHDVEEETGFTALQLAQDMGYAAGVDILRKLHDA